jgi:hypothetical protein
MAGGAGAALAQGLSLAGTVRDAEGRPLAGVAVRLATRSAGTRVTATDDSGRYVLGDLDAAFYVVSFEREGYTTVTRRLQVSFEEEEADRAARDVVLARARPGPQ